MSPRSIRWRVHPRPHGSRCTPAEVRRKLPSASAASIDASALTAPPNASGVSGSPNCAVYSASLIPPRCAYALVAAAPSAVSGAEGVADHGDNRRFEFEKL